MWFLERTVGKKLMIDKAKRTQHDHDSSLCSGELKFSVHMKIRAAEFGTSFTSRYPESP